MSESRSKDETESGGEDTSATVSVSSSGQATIPKKFRDKLGIDAPGQVTFRETDDGEVVIERVRSAQEMAGFAARSGEPSTDNPASEMLREKREADKAERDSE
ncbi:MULTISPECIES: AbrB/MazE/SpoVT family DNA-binding domain-containing protein [unclassified Halorubrum]|jgi:AbrB family looped-hinge helix DNA binding protein|uniref:AbrB/MazE/SpoVT family DNA-binding domain-containing protein n=1 Tax=unclassified Halorubrum TaxID=2642239 RepID=UPI0010F51945|nr:MULTISPECIES: AbrB/MazE/SpoVT family DNA-binding domain-containing protein [unclassified Halorubrum]TKX43490.1 AbrB/MazE/SpoVT family DNA-binding domain-containing protein [Halorubrum sp. ARQ200]TKX50689.1 AbrB/MazE/SpoVT family DNA-binding domain-containing protein [Halorubrum sp. ASP121]TKX62116.1 AbrB/MazE/SpoVT family DNA-binding domain-containing protein [Halorubrum sp. ASP1]